MAKFGEALNKTKVVGVRERIKQGLDPESFKEWEQAMKNQEISSAAIQKALRTLGVTVSAMSIQRMRNE
jgi:hypothetical protein